MTEMNDSSASPAALTYAALSDVTTALVLNPQHAHLPLHMPSSQAMPVHTSGKMRAQAQDNAC